MARKPSENEIMPPSSWKCPKCDNKATVNVALKQPPRCQNETHKGNAYEMERKA